MKRKQIRGIAIGLILTLAGAAPLMAADAPKQADAPAAQAHRNAPPSGARYNLSMEQMDGVHAGRINLCEPGMCPQHAPPDPSHGAGCNQCPVIWNSGVDGPIIIWDRSGR